MDLSAYIKKSQTQGKKSFSNVERKCHECGRVLEKSGDYLFRQGFCSEKCKRDYIGK